MTEPRKLTKEELEWWDAAGHRQLMSFVLTLNIGEGVVLPFGNREFMTRFFGPRSWAKSPQDHLFDFGKALRKRADQRQQLFEFTVFDELTLKELASQWTNEFPLPSLHDAWVRRIR